jgi:glycyl-tRNA synthetase beta chain
MSHRDFLVELGTEELPPKALHELELAFAKGLKAGLDGAAFAHGAVHSFSTPRRLAVWVHRLAGRQPDQEVKRRGPPISAAFDSSGRPTKAAVAFAESCGTTIDRLKRLDEGKSPALFFVGRKEGQPVDRLLPDIVRAALEALPIPKRMRWGTGDAEFVRPVHWLVMLYGSQVVPATLLNVTSGSISCGHRFHAPKPLRLASPARYAATLRERGYVIADFNERREIIRSQVLKQAREAGGSAVVDENLLEEVTALVEWPVALVGRFEQRFLQLPREVLISTLQGHQRYFPVEDGAGALLPLFVAVSNIESRDPAKVTEGNERVVRPRLADALFFWSQDRKQPLESRRAALDTVIFNAELGELSSLGEKTNRISMVAGTIAHQCGGNSTLAGRAAQLSKCDLLTAMVGEFPELQGVIGSSYAQADGEDGEVATALREQYLPRAAGDRLPETKTGIALSIADKLDTLVVPFYAGQKPSGNKDPFGLRRAAIGIVRILLERNIQLDLRQLIEALLSSLAPPRYHLFESVSDEIYAFIMERMRVYYLESTSVEGPTQSALKITPEMFDSVLATRTPSPLDFDARLRALAAFLTLPEAASLTAANKRIANILRKAGAELSDTIDVEMLKQTAEVQLYDAMHAKQDAVRNAVAQREYTAALGHLAQLRPVVDSFFDQVMVMDENPAIRANRLALLAKLRSLFAGVADISRLPG